MPIFVSYDDPRIIAGQAQAVAQFRAQEIERENARREQLMQDQRFREMQAMGERALTRSQNNREADLRFDLQRQRMDQQTERQIMQDQLARERLRAALERAQMIQQGQDNRLDRRLEADTARQERGLAFQGEKFQQEMGLRRELSANSTARTEMIQQGAAQRQGERMTMQQQRDAEQRQLAEQREARRKRAEAVRFEIEQAKWRASQALQIGNRAEANRIMADELPGLEAEYRSLLMEELGKTQQAAPTPAVEMPPQQGVEIPLRQGGGRPMTVQQVMDVAREVGAQNVRQWAIENGFDPDNVVD
jgi:hypothetical protein